MGNNMSMNDWAKMFVDQTLAKTSAKNKESMDLTSAAIDSSAISFGSEPAENKVITPVD